LRSLHLTSDRLKLTGIVDLVEGGEHGNRIVDYKRGSARRAENGDRIAKEYDAIQLAAHALMLEEAGTVVTAASIYYAADKRHVEVPLTDALFAQTLEMIARARELGAGGRIPPPLDSHRPISHAPTMEITASRFKLRANAPEGQNAISYQPPRNRRMAIPGP